MAFLRGESVPHREGYLAKAALPEETAVKPSSTFDEFNGSINEMAAILGKHHGDTWESQIQDCEERLPLESMALKQALATIIDNAFEHGRSPQTVRLRFTVRDSQAEYLITNSGSRFSDDAIAHGTEKGFSEKPVDGQNVRGLGLYFAGRFLEEQGGRLALSNTPDGCACVQVLIPLRAHDPKTSRQDA